MKKAIVLAATLILLATAGMGSLHAASPVQQEQNVCLISSPASGSLLHGQVVISGSALHAEFTWYQIGYAPDPNPDGKWTFFTSSETAVRARQLGLWNTTQARDGVYQLLMEVHRKDGNHDLCFVRQLRVNNSEPTPTFTAEALPTPAETPTPFPTPDDTPTVAIEQPPTATPRATPTYSAVDNPTPTPETAGLKLPIDPGSIRTASCRGAQLTVVLFVVLVLYLLIRNIAVTGIRKVRKPRDVEGFHTRRPREH